MGTLTEPGKPSGEESRADALAHVRGIVDTVREPLLVLDGRLRVRSANRSFYRTFRVSPRATEGQLLYDLGNGQWDIARLHSLLEEILSQNASFDDYEVEHDFPDIGRKVMLLNARRLRQAGTELILLAIEDVTEQRRLEAERRAIETRFTSLVKNIKDHSIFTIDAEGQVTSWNVAAEQILGYSEAEALGRHFSFIFTPEDREQGLPDAELRAAREHGRAEDERWHLRKGGERFWALGIVSALHDAEGRLSGFSKILRDMTERKRSEQALRDREKRFRALVEASSDVVFRMSPDWTEMRQLVGLDFIPETEAPSQTWLETCIPPTTGPGLRSPSTMPFAPRACSSWNTGSSAWMAAWAGPCRARSPFSMRPAQSPNGSAWRATSPSARKTMRNARACWTRSRSSEIAYRPCWIAYRTRCGSPTRKGGLHWPTPRR
jgi:PAS domain S-box-containing protein